jgi:cysteine desulfurase
MLDRIYMDYSATTPVAEEVLDSMIPYFTQKFGNAGSRNHSFGWEAEEATEEARSRIAKVIKADSKEVIFTSGATESNNIAIKGAAKYLKKNKGKNHIITLGIEHKCVIESCSYLENEGFKVTYLEVGPNGIVDMNQLYDAITKETGLVSIAMVHNEIGVIQPIEYIGRLCRDKGIIFHTDAAQALGRVEIDVEKCCIDLLSLSAHKFYGPKGVGALYVRRGVRLDRVVSGGGQEKGIRSGTLPVPLCVGMGVAATIAEQKRESEWQRMIQLRDYMHNRIMKELPEVSLNGDFVQRVPHNLNYNFAYVEGESLMMYLKGVAVSSGSACTSGSLEPSYVVSALGTPEELVHSAIRLVFGRYTTMEEVKEVTDRIINAVNLLRSISPLWSMRQKGLDISQVKWVNVH